MGRAEYLAGILTFAIGAPVLFLLASALADGEVRRHETPLRAMLGPAYEALARGEETDEHYMGDDRLAPDFALEDAAGEEWRLSDHRGQVVVMNFWTVTCGPCIEEMPMLVDLARIVQDRDDIELVAITIDREWADVAEVVPTDGALHILRDADRSVVGERFGTTLFPETWIIDPQGVIRLRVDGARDWSSAVALDVIESFL